MQRGIDRARVDLEDAASRGVDHLHEAVAVARAPAKRLEDDEVEGALEELDTGEGGLLVALDHGGSAGGLGISSLWGGV